MASSEGVGTRAAESIEVRVDGRGVARGEDLRADETVQARCDLCGEGAEAVVSIAKKGDTSALFGCAECIRNRLGAISIARWRLQEAHRTPWGKFSG